MAMSAVTSAEVKTAAIAAATVVRPPMTPPSAVPNSAPDSRIGSPSSAVGSPPSPGSQSSIGSRTSVRSSRAPKRVNWFESSTTVRIQVRALSTAPSGSRFCSEAAIDPTSNRPRTSVSVSTKT
jgi:hypothetical protein